MATQTRQARTHSRRFPHDSCHERSAGYDADNAFFTEDFEELRTAGYLTLPVPRELGGPGFTLAQVAGEQRRLAYYAAPTALAIKMHIYLVSISVRHGC